MPRRASGSREGKLPRTSAAMAKVKSVYGWMDSGSGGRSTLNWTDLWA